MSRPVIESAERVLSRLSTCCKTKGTCGDITDVCRAYLSEHRPDDDTLADVEWCKTLKEWDRSRDGDFYRGFCGLAIGFYKGEPRLWCGGTVVKVGPTRGDVRELCKALKLESVEERQTV